MGRKVGERIRQVVEIVEAGAKTTPEIRAALGYPIDASEVGKYCSRAVGLNLMSVDRTKHPHEFKALPDWRRSADEAGANKRPVVRRYKMPNVNSVFALGGVK